MAGRAFLCFLGWTICLALAADTLRADPSAKSGDRRIAAWSFEDSTAGRFEDTSGNGYHASFEPSSSAVAPAEGLFGQAVGFSGNHLVRVAGPEFGKLPQIAITAWVLPRELGSYREIFRKEDGDRRVLFSFQHNGTILSLGLNIGGYIECDAPLDPAQVLDGAWHHCAATFDGRVMRVFFDGREIGALERPGAIAAGGPAPGCIGSSSGGECFQGQIDELVLYRTALAADEVAAEYRRGVESLERMAQEIQSRVGAIYAAGPSLAETLAQTRKKAADEGVTLDRALAGALATRMKAEFPTEYEEFARFTPGPVEYLIACGNDFNHREAARLVELLLEYKPLTAEQKARQTADQMRRWDEADAIRARVDNLVAQGDQAAWSPEWIALMLEAGRRIQFRPHVSEAVAPYVRPETLVARNRTAGEAAEILRNDWLHQADGHPTRERIAREIAWTRELAERISRQHPGRTDFARELAELAGIETRLAAIGDEDAGLYCEVRRIKRAIALANPAVDFNRILLVDMPYPQGSEWRHETRHRLGYMAVPGGRLLVLEGLSPDGNVRQLAPQAPLDGSFWRPDLSYDAQKVLFCFKPHNEKSFHLYEVNLDGTDLVQLTDGPYDDLDPIYLPDDRHIIFSTTRAHTYVRCMPPTNAFILARCDRDGKNVYLISSNNEPDYLPSVMNDGRVIYTRWEYTDKPLWRAQKLWTINPDGTQVSTFWGNQSVWPDLLKDARAIPGSRRVMFTGSAHHDWFSGSVGIIDPDGGFNFPDGLTKITAEVPWPESGNGPVDPVESASYHASGVYRGYYSPYPLSEQDFLVSAERNGKFVLYLMDVEGNRELVYEGTNNVFHAIPVRPRPKPPLIADRVAWPGKAQRLAPQEGVIFSSNVYHGAPLELAGKARFLRILNIEPKTYTYWYKRPYISTGPVVSAVQSDGVKRILGTVPIEADGSVAFRAPAGVSLHFQLLDENERALQTMRSFVGIMPGERRGCLGCHESHSRTPAHEDRGLVLAGEPRTITPPPWGDESVSFPRFVQPVLDRYCGKCHQGSGEGRTALDLTDRPGFLIFSEPYMILTGRPTWGAPYQKPADPPPGFGIADTILVEGYSTVDPQAYITPRPMTALSYRSRLVEIASSGKHYDVKVDPVSLARLIAWVDTMCPYRGSEEIREIDDPDFQGVDWLAVRPRIKTAPTIVRPGPVDVEQEQ